MEVTKNPEHDNIASHSITPSNNQIKLSEEQEHFITEVLDNKKSVVLLGKAGVGKSTAINALCKEADARGLSYIIAAPTGIAAINVGGQTVHRFISQLKRFGTEQLLKLDFILVDESSMFRADLVDELSDCLKSKFLSNDPFGGVQMVLVGDPGQLPPVVNSRDKAEKRYLDEHYLSPNFFSAAAFGSDLSKWTVIELTQVFRQKDEKFPKLLNLVREGKKEKPLAYLNKFKLTREPRGVILTGRNADAELINRQQLNNLHNQPFTYSADIIGDISPRDFPADEHLTLKMGARVMVIKNIYEAYTETESILSLINGDVGTVVELDSECVKIECERTGEVHTLCSETWIKTGSKFNEETRKLEKIEVGRFSQIPLRLAWAITIHKSQGATIEELTIDFRKPMFAPGQAYVALSRGVSLENLWIMGRIRPTDIKTDKAVADFLSKRLDSKYVGIKKGSQFDLPDTPEATEEEMQNALDEMF